MVGLGRPASSHSAAATVLVVLFSRTKHWAARSSNPFPPQVWVHLDQSPVIQTKLTSEGSPGGEGWVMVVRLEMLDYVGLRQCAIAWFVLVASRVTR